MNVVSFYSVTRLEEAGEGVTLIELRVKYRAVSHLEDEVFERTD